MALYFTLSFYVQVSREQYYEDLGKEAMEKIEIDEDPYVACAGIVYYNRMPVHHSILEYQSIRV